MVDHPSQLRFWILKDTDENNSFSDQSAFTTRIITSDIRIQPSDVAYLWRQEDSSYFYAQGRFESVLIKRERLPNNQPVGAERLAWTIRVDRILKPIMTSEVEDKRFLTQVTEDLRSLKLHDICFTHGARSEAIDISKHLVDHSFIRERIQQNCT